MTSRPTANRMPIRFSKVGQLLTVAGLTVMSAAACATGKSTGQPSSELSSGGGGTQIIQNPDLLQTGAALNLANLSLSAKSEVPLGINEAWRRLNAAYASLGFALSVQDEKTHIVGNTSFRARRKVGDVQLRNALECGGDTSAPNAESYDITMGIRSQLVSLSPEKVQLETFVDGIGKNPLTNSTATVKCITQGVFEKKIADMVNSGVVPPVKK